MRLGLAQKTRHSQVLRNEQIGGYNPPMCNETGALTSRHHHIRTRLIDSMNGKKCARVLTPNE